MATPPDARPATSDPWPGHAVLQLPVPLLEGFVRARYQHYDPSLLGRGLGTEPFVHAHATVLGPFDAPPERARLSRLSRAARPLVLELGQVVTFPNGIIHAPVRGDGLSDLLRAAQQEFVEVTPYRGEFAVQPHVTLDASGPGVDQAWVAGQLGGLLPATIRVEVLDLVWYQQHHTRLLHRIPMG